MENGFSQTDGDDAARSKPAGFLRWLTLWPLLLGPATMVWVYVATTTGNDRFVSRGANENMALMLLALPLVGFGVQAFLYRSEFRLFMAILCAGFFCREWHFVGTSNGVYVMLVVLACWAVKRKEALEAEIGKSHLNSWVWATFSAYVLSQLIARRVFRYVHLPQEAELHVPLEESVETMAHLMMIATCIIAWIKVLYDSRKRSLPSD